MPQKLRHLIDGHLVNERNLIVSARDLGLLRGFSVFDFLITYNNRPFMLDEHIERLLKSASMINLHHPWTKESLKGLVSKTLKANSPGFEKTIKILLSGGESSDGFTPEGKTKLIILIGEWKGYPGKIHQKGIRLATHKFKRYLPQAKTTHYTEVLKHHSTLKDTFEILYYDARQVYECSRSNIFACINGQMLTPKTHILPGVTRKVILEKLSLKIPAKEENFKLESLLQAEEVFITKSSGEIIPVVKIDSQFIGTGKVGEKTKHVVAKFKEFVQKGEW